MTFPRALWYPWVTLCRLLLAGLCSLVPVHAAEPVKILHVDSYHQGFTWSYGIDEGIRSRLLVENVWYQTVYLDAWRNLSHSGPAPGTERILQAIRSLAPDVVITSDDAATKVVLGISDSLPDTRFVFCAVNWSASAYGLPAERVTGILEVPLARSLVDLLSQYAAGNRIGFLSLDTLSARKDLEYYPRHLGRDFDHVFLVRNLDQWKDRFRELQGSVDLLILHTPEDTEGWDDDEVRAFVRQETRIPVGSTYESLAPVSLFSLARIPQEHGWWAADAAMKIMSGTSPSDIPVSTNREGRLIVNLDLALRLGLTISQELLEIADILKQPTP